MLVSIQLLTHIIKVCPCINFVNFYLQLTSVALRLITDNSSVSIPTLQSGSQMLRSLSLRLWKKLAIRLFLTCIQITGKSIKKSMCASPTYQCMIRYATLGNAFEPQNDCSMELCGFVWQLEFAFCLCSAGRYTWTLWFVLAELWLDALEYFPSCSKLNMTVINVGQFWGLFSRIHIQRWKLVLVQSVNQKDHLLLTLNRWILSCSFF